MGGDTAEVRDRNAGASGELPAASPRSAPSASGAGAEPGSDPVSGLAAAPSFFHRHRLPLALAVIALCLYAGSIVYILFGRGQIA